ncbi:MAG: hypothetical protein QS721_14265 [Candidatus Endonucleobacter sp. (ex Gigantidas childressi)]|nr:hypothetical protein [Candidatus Endonucleobacter sp. (ex Gigantidas childressi)]
MNISRFVFRNFFFPVFLVFCSCFSIAVIASPPVFVVASQVYAASTFYGGWRDVVAGVKTIQMLKSQYPESKISFIVGSSYDMGNRHSKDKYDTFSTISKIDGVEVILINAHEDCAQECERATEKAKILLDSADLIIHAPSFIISPIAKNSDQYVGKMIYFNGYHKGSYIGLKAEDKYIQGGMVYLDTGLCQAGVGAVSKVRNGMFLKAKELPSREFDSEFLRENLTIPAEGEGLEKSFYFNYAYSVINFTELVLFPHFVEGTSTDNIKIVTSVPIGIESHTKNIFRMSALMGDELTINKITLIREGREDLVINNSEADKLITGRSITIISPRAYTLDDSLRMSKYAKCSVSTGDHSMADPLSMGRLPIPSIRHIGDSARALCSDVRSFVDSYDGEKLLKDMGEIFEACAMATGVINDACSADVGGDGVELGRLNDAIRSYAEFGKNQWLQFEDLYVKHLLSNDGNFLEDNLLKCIERKLTKEELSD